MRYTLQIHDDDGTLLESLELQEIEMTPNAAKQLLATAQSFVATAAGDAKREYFDTVLLREADTLLGAYVLCTRNRKHGALPSEYHAARAELDWLQNAARWGKDT